MGERVGLVGPNGAGKTTLFLCLAGVLRVPAGVVSICGLDPGNPAHRRTLPTKLGVVFQDSDDQVFNPTVYEDVAFGPLNLGLPPDEIHARVDDAIKQVGLTGREQRVPYQLSGGEKRRAALAGVLAMKPEVVLFDEPTIFLDPRGRRALAGVMQSLPGTQIIAAHDLQFVARICKRVMVMDGGKIVADGPTHDILTNVDLMERHGLEALSG
jgi:cobalt/nickel transport system ATP-binding protein